MILKKNLVNQVRLEVEIQYKLNHPSILKLYDHYEDDNNIYLVLEYCQNGQLYDLLQKKNRLSDKEAAKYVGQIVSAIDYLHSLKHPVIHRDIKPENILLDKDDNVKLADFGWANYQYGDNLRYSISGTPLYMSPEMIKKTGHTTTHDIWNLGILIYELLSGELPFAGKTERELFSNIQHMEIDWPANISVEAQDLINGLLQDDPSKRFKPSEILH